MKPFFNAAAPVILLDVEGTTTPVDFVHNTLFPYACDHADEFLSRHWDEEEVCADILKLRKEYELEAGLHSFPHAWIDEPPADRRASALSYMQWLTQRDVKSTALKSLQGKIWQEGYEQHHFRSRIFPDVRPAFERWAQRNWRICIYSSGSVLAQQLLFSNTQLGNLAPYIDRYFDTTVGSKISPLSYRRIIGCTDWPVSETVFISDSIQELDAARAAGLTTILCLRENAAVPATHTHPVIRTFDDLP